MRAAPAVELTVAPDPLWRGGVSALILAALAALLAWAWQATFLAAHWRWGAFLLAVLLLGRLWRRERAARVLSLRWDGQGWHWREPPARHECSGQLRVVADLGGWLLLQLQPHPGARQRSRWLALGRRAFPGKWHALRCAVHGSSLSQTPAGDAVSPGPHER